MAHREQFAGDSGVVGLIDREETITSAEDEAVSEPDGDIVIGGLNTAEAVTDQQIDLETELKHETGSQTDEALSSDPLFHLQQPSEPLHLDEYLDSLNDNEGISDSAGDIEEPSEPATAKANESFVAKEGESLEDQLEEPYRSACLKMREQGKNEWYQRLEDEDTAGEEAWMRLTLEGEGGHQRLNIELELVAKAAEGEFKARYRENEDGEDEYYDNQNQVWKKLKDSLEGDELAAYEAAKAAGQDEYEVEYPEQGIVVIYNFKTGVSKSEPLEIKPEEQPFDDEEGDYDDGADFGLDDIPASEDLTLAPPVSTFPAFGETLSSATVPEQHSEIMPDSTHTSTPEQLGDSDRSEPANHDVDNAYQAPEGADSVQPVASVDTTPLAPPQAPTPVNAPIQTSAEAPAISQSLSEQSFDTTGITTATTNNAEYTFTTTIAAEAAPQVTQFNETKPPSAQPNKSLQPAAIKQFIKEQPITASEVPPYTTPSSEAHTTPALEHSASEIAPESPTDPSKTEMVAGQSYTIKTDKPPSATPSAPSQPSAPDNSGPSGGGLVESAPANHADKVTAAPVRMESATPVIAEVAAPNARNEIAAPSIGAETTATKPAELQAQIQPAAETRAQAQTEAQSQATAETGTVNQAIMEPTVAISEPTIATTEPATVTAEPVASTANTAAAESATTTTEAAAAAAEHMVAITNPAAAAKAEPVPAQNITATTQRTRPQQEQTSTITSQEIASSQEISPNQTNSPDRWVASSSGAEALTRQQDTDDQTSSPYAAQESDDLEISFEPGQRTSANRKHQRARRTATI